MCSFRTRSVVAALLLSTLVAAACSDDSGKAASNSTAAATTTSSSGGPVTSAPPTTTALPNRPFKVMVVGEFTNVIALTVKDTLAATQAALKDVPGAEVIGCDSKGDANAAIACEREAVADGVAAVVTGYSGIMGNQDILTKAGIPTLGDVDATAPAAFALENVAGAFAGVGVGIGVAGCKKAGDLLFNGTDFIADSIKAGIETTGGTEVARSLVANNAPDLAPAVAKLLDAGADCITLDVTPNMVVQSLTAIDQSGKKPTVALVSAVFPADTRKTVGKLGENVLSIASLISPDDASPIIAQIKADMKPFDDKSELTTFGVTAWTSGKLIEAAVRKMDGPVNAQTLLASLNSLRDIAIPTIHNFSAVELPNPAFKRFFNHFLLNYRIHDGVPVRQGDFYDIEAALPK